MKVKYVLIDLRAGFSELSAPLLFDPRIIRFLITTYSGQSIDGMKLVLGQLAKIVPIQDEMRAKDFYDPVLIFSMVPEKLRNFPKFIETQQELISLYPDYGDDDATPPRLMTATTYFAEELLYLERLDNLKS